MTLFRILLILSFVCFTQAQEKKYQSLLWKISGNGLQKNSYMYGTMHVSEKISYHLSDAFFKHLLAADFVANESEPSTWSSLHDIMNFPENNYDDSYFFLNFYQKPINKTEILKHFRNQNFNINNLLYRTNNIRNDFQEDTYLDMFIYQTAKKNNIITLGLEDVKKSLKLSINIDNDEETPNEENLKKLNKILKGKSQFEAMTDFYRDKDLDRLDSLTMLTSPKSFINNMLFIRNEIMIKSMDSIMQHGSLFAAVGAAHLPGDNGMIEMLKRKGYKVTPIFSDYTEVGKNTKKKIDELFVKPPLKTFTTEDGIIEIPLFEMVLKQGKDINSPDLKNGGYINIKRTSLMSVFNKNKQQNIHQTIDSLLFENIPGDILEKKYTETKHYKLFDIKNKTKSGSLQRYQFYITPLELISVSMVGPKDYVALYQDLVFPYINLKHDSPSWQLWKPFHKTFSLKIPTNSVIYHDIENPVYSTNLEMYGYDETESFYWLKEQVYKDIALSDHPFEVKRLHQELLTQVDAQNSLQFIEKQPHYAISNAQVYGQNTYLKSQIVGTSMILIGCSNCTKEQFYDYTATFSNNRPQEVENNLVDYVDNAAHFSVPVPAKQNELYFLRENKKSIPKQNKKTNLFEPFSSSFEFRDKKNNTVEVSTYEYHPYEYEKSLDSILIDFKKKYLFAKNTNDIDSDNQENIFLENNEVATEDLEDDIYDEFIYNYYGSKKAGRIISNWDKKLGLDKLLKFNEQAKLEDEVVNINKENNTIDYQTYITHPLSENKVKLKLIVRDGIQYKLTSLVPKESEQINDFVLNFFENFKPKDTLLGHQIFEPKLERFLNDFNQDDESIRFSAIQSIEYLSMTTEDFQLIEDFFENSYFEDDELESIAKIYEKVGSIKDNRTIDFLSRNYLKEEVSPSSQFAILRGLTKQKSKRAYQKIGYLMHQDLPISDNEYDIIKLFKLFEADLEHSQVLMPKIFEFYSIPEYNKPLISFAKKLVENKKLSAKQLKNYKKLILTNAKLEHKRVKSWLIKSYQNNEDYSQRLEVINNLSNFLYLIEPFKKENDFRQLWQNIKKFNITELNIEMLALESSKGQVLKTWAEELLEDPVAKFYAYLILKKNKSNLIQKNIEEDKMALAAVYLMDVINPLKSQVTFLEKKTATIDQKNVVFFFYKKTNLDAQSSSYFYDNQPKLLSIGFALDDKSDIIWEAFYSGLQRTIDDEDKLSHYYDEIIDKSLNEYRARASFGKIDNTYQNFLSFYDDF